MILFVRALAAAFALSSAYACPARAETGATIELSCAGGLAEGRSGAAVVKGTAIALEVSATFGEGEILALVEPQTRKIEPPLYDAEATSGALRFSDGDATTIIWTRMSGRDGPLLGVAVLSDGDVLTLSVDRPSGGAGRAFALFLAADSSLYRGHCTPK